MGSGLVSTANTTFLLESMGALKNASSNVCMYSGHHHIWNLNSDKCPLLKVKNLEYSSPKSSFQLQNVCWLVCDSVSSFFFCLYETAGSTRNDYLTNLAKCWWCFNWNIRFYKTLVPKDQNKIFLFIISYLFFSSY